MSFTVSVNGNTLAFKRCTSGCSESDKGCPEFEEDAGGLASQSLQNISQGLVTTYLSSKNLDLPCTIIGRLVTSPCEHIAVSVN